MPGFLPSKLLEDALSEGHAREECFDDAAYVRFADDHHGVPRGTVVIERQVVPAFPSIARIFALERGVRRAFSARFHAEEKLDGYNVRVVRVGGRLLPFTRGGFICPFTADRLTDLAELAPLFEHAADLVLCAEVVGPDNPYLESTSPRAPEDLRLFAFDLMRLDREETVPVEERNRLFTSFGVPHVPFLGWFAPEEIGRIREEVLRLDAERAEGIIFKPEAEGLRVKYITPAVNVEDIALDGSLLAELPAEFFLGRILRLAVAIEELQLHERIPAAEEKIGHALLSGFLPVLREVENGGKVRKVHRVRLHSEAAADRLITHLNRASKKVQARELERRREGDWVHLTFEKTFQQSTSRLKNLLDGEYVID